MRRSFIAINISHQPVSYERQEEQATPSNPVSRNAGEIVRSRARSEPRERSKRTNNQALQGLAGEKSDCGARVLVRLLRARLLTISLTFQSRLDQWFSYVTSDLRIHVDT